MSTFKRRAMIVVICKWQWTNIYRRNSCTLWELCDCRFAYYPQMGSVFVCYVCASVCWQNYELFVFFSLFFQLLPNGFFTPYWTVFISFIFCSFHIFLIKQQFFSNSLWNCFLITFTQKSQSTIFFLLIFFRKWLFIMSVFFQHEFGSVYVWLAINRN